MSARKNGAADAKKPKLSRRTLFTRVLCAVLALLMVASSIYILLEILLH